MAVITPKVAALGGVDPLAYVAAAGGGDSFVALSGAVYLIHIKNGGGALITITIDDPNTPLPLGAAASSTFADVAVSVPNAGERMIVLSDIGRFTGPTGSVNLAYSAVTTVTLQVIKVLLMARPRPGPRPLDRFVWVQKSVDGEIRQMRVSRSQLPSLNEHWERIADPTREAAASEPDDSPVTVKKPVKKQPSTAAESAPKKE